MDLQQLPKNDFLWTAFHMYRASDRTTTLKSERNRTVYAESFDITQIPPLATLCLKVIAENYKGGQINLKIKPIQLKTFYDFIDTELPLSQCININDEYYWKRAYAARCTDKMLLKQKNNEQGICWKNLVIALKYVEILESTPYEIWIHDEMEKLTKMVSPYVNELQINKLQPMRESTFPKVPPRDETPSMSLLEYAEMDEIGEQFIEVEEEENEVEYDYPIEECHHIDLSCVKNLSCLHSLTIEFLPPELGINYHSRYFNFSYVDMQNLASGIAELHQLKVFKIRRSRMDFVKLSTILEALKTIFVEHLEFYFCQLDDECGESLYEFLNSTICLQHLDLSGNYFKDPGIIYLADGIKASASKLKYVGLSNNPLSDDSMCKITKTLLRCKQLNHVTLSGINVSPSGGDCIARLIKLHNNLEYLEIIAVPMDGYTLINALENNPKIQQLLCQGSGLTLEEEFKIELLLKRNRYIKENPYIGDSSKTEEEIVAYVSRTKNPVLLRALAESAKRAECLRKQAEREKTPSEESSDIHIPRSSEDRQAPTTSKEFFYNSEHFTEEELDQRVILFGQTEKSFFKKLSSQKNQ